MPLIQAVLMTASRRSSPIGLRLSTHVVRTERTPRAQSARGVAYENAREGEVWSAVGCVVGHPDPR